MIKIKKYVEELRGKGYDISKGIESSFSCVVRGKLGDETTRKTVYCTHFWVGLEIINIIVVKTSKGYTVKMGEPTKEKVIGVAHSQRDVISILNRELGF